MSSIKVNRFIKGSSVYF